MMMTKLRYMRRKRWEESFIATRGGLAISQNSLTRLSWNLASTAIGLSSALLVLGCGGPEYRPSASTEANQSVKPAPKKSDKQIVIAQPGANQKNVGQNNSAIVAVDPATQAILNACIAAAKAVSSGQTTAGQPKSPASVAPVGATPATTVASSVSTITCSDGKTYQLPIGVQQNAQSQQSRPVVQMPRQP